MAEPTEGKKLWVALYQQPAGAFRTAGDMYNFSFFICNSNAGFPKSKSGLNLVGVEEIPEKWAKEFQNPPNEPKK